MVAPATIAQTPPEWVATFGGSGALAQHIVADAAPASGGGYFVAGITSSFGQGEQDGWVARIAADGSTLWEFAIGTPDPDEFNSIAVTPDGGCILVGITGSYMAGESDGWIVKLSSSGVVEWQSTFDAGGNETFVSVALPSSFSLSYYVAGVLDYLGNEDVWILKLDSSGAPTWQKRFRGNRSDRSDIVAALTTTGDGGLAFVANSDSTFVPDEAVPFHRPWIVRLDSNGTPVAQRTFSWIGGDLLHDIVRTPDDGFVLTGEIGASQFFRGDVWALRLDEDLDIIWNQSYGHIPPGGPEVWDAGERIRVTPQGTYLVVGSTSVPLGSGPLNPLLWLLRLDGSGNLLADRTFGGPGYDEGHALAISSIGGVAVGGRSQPTIAGPGTAFLAQVPLNWGSFNPACPPPAATSPVLSVRPLTIGEPDVEPTDVVASSAHGVGIPLSLITGTFHCQGQP